MVRFRCGAGKSLLSGQDFAPDHLVNLQRPLDALAGSDEYPLINRKVGLLGNNPVFEKSGIGAKAKSARGFRARSQYDRFRCQFGDNGGEGEVTAGNKVLGHAAIDGSARISRGRVGFR